MKHVLTFLIVSLVSINANAQANDGLSNFILQKQLKASQLKMNTEMKVQKLRSLPSNGVYFVNTTPKVESTEEAMVPPTAKELDNLVPAAGGNKSHSDKAAKISTK